MVREGRYMSGFHATARQFQRGLTNQDIQMAVGHDAPEVIEDYPDGSTRTQLLDSRRASGRAGCPRVVYFDRSRLSDYVLLAGSESLGRIRSVPMLTARLGGNVLKCPECRGTIFDEGLRDLPRIIDQRLVLLKNVQSLQCRQCGYLVISPEVMRKIERVADQAPSGVISVPVFDLSVVPSEEKVA